MPKTIIPEKLKEGDEIRVIAPAKSMKLPFITQETRERAQKSLEALGLKVSFGKHLEELDAFESTSVSNRLEDLHDAFRDTNVKAVITITGGYNSNQLLEKIDYGLIERNPKILVGYSDITALENAIFRKTGLVTYSGPHFFSFGKNPEDDDYTASHFVKCLFGSKPFSVKPSKSVAEWSGSKDEMIAYENGGNWKLQEGKARGRIVGANLCTFNLLQGTEFMPSLKGSILFIEDDHESNRYLFDRDFQSLLHQPSAKGIRGIVIGRFQEDSDVPREILEQIVGTKGLEGIPVLANVDFGHTYPLMTFPIGGTASLKVDENGTELRILRH